MVLSDVDIIERISSDELEIEPYKESNVEPASVDLRLGSTFLLVKVKKEYTEERGFSVTLDDVDDTFRYEETEDSVRIKPNELVLATTKERVSMPDDLAAEVLGRSSLGRLGISVHQTAGYIDPGFSGEITLELSNHGPAPVKLHSGERVCQIVFSECSSPALHPYGHEDSHYQNQTGPTPSRIELLDQNS